MSLGLILLLVGLVIAFAVSHALGVLLILIGAILLIVEYSGGIRRR